MTSSKDGAVKVESDDGVHSCFFYGTLMVPDVFFTVCHNDANPPAAIKAMYSFTPAILHDYSRHRVKHAAYPGIKANPKEKVFGVYATGLTKANMDKLDYFEGDEYVREKVKVKLLEKLGDEATGEGNVEGEERETSVYVFHKELVGDLDDREWDLAEFKRDKMSMWTREGHTFDGCDPDRPAAVAD